MSSTADLVQAIKIELKSAHMTYAALAKKLGLAESSVKRMFARNDMPLVRVDAILHVLKLDFADLARKVADARLQLSELTEAQEREVVSDRQLLLVAICVMSHWTFEQMLANYRITETETIRCLAGLDRIGIIELRPLNRYRLKLSKSFRWRPGGPVLAYFREHAVKDYFSGSFDGPGEGVHLVHGSIARSTAPAFLERLQRLAQDFSQQQLADQKVADADREGYTLLLAMRSWEFAAFASLRRASGARDAAAANLPSRTVLPAVSRSPPRPRASPSR